MTVYGAVHYYFFFVLRYIFLLMCNCSSTIRDKIIPHAVSWFTGEAAQSDFEDIDEVDYDDEEGDEDEDEDEDEEEEEEEEEEKKGKSRSKVWMESVIWHILFYSWIRLHLLIYVFFC